MTGKVSRFVYWTPRILSIMFILLLTLFSFDVITPELSLGEIIIGLLVHNIPAIILLVTLIISWKYEIVGGIVFLIAGLLYVIFVLQVDIPWYRAIIWTLSISGPAFVISILFLLNWNKKKKAV